MKRQMKTHWMKMEVFENLPTRKQRIYNEMVEFQKELRKQTGW